MHKTRVMLCDDEAGYRHLVRAVLEPLSDAEYVETSDGQACVDAVTADPVDAVLIDLNMPRRDGYDAIPALRSALPEAKIIALSTATEAEAEDRTLALGADAFVEKPRDILELPALICRKLAA